ncbi:uncharacterized protein TM35_000441360 [Trypanosoma theileri]|uniref:Uncharacterized protein n=1 Tax=Trypanosoma theileri TaxID=67003 RepID=A0A1X0NK48_9TRYP|nr:uncharacterized protein TM35_000441360 [Trypanosoma theileri]ORC84480.1 hypothetical protein TM35_000441360 [Trypanosoma theileri]
MNSLGGQFQCVILLVSGRGEETITSTSQSVAVVLPMELTQSSTPLCESVAIHIRDFCALHDISCVDWGHDTSALLTACAERTDTYTHVSLLRCEDAAIASVREELLAQRRPAVLIVQLACETAVPCGRDELQYNTVPNCVDAAVAVNPNDDKRRWGWLRPVQSCMAELPGCRGVCLAALLHSALPLLRARVATPPPKWTTAAVTMDGLLREVGYKVGCLPKYGS